MMMLWIFMVIKVLALVAVVPGSRGGWLGPEPAAGRLCPLLRFGIGAAQRILHVVPGGTGFQHGEVNVAVRVAIPDEEDSDGASVFVLICFDQVYLFPSDEAFKLSFRLIAVRLVLFGCINAAQSHADTVRSLPQYCCVSVRHVGTVPGRCLLRADFFHAGRIDELPLGIKVGDEDACEKNQQGHPGYFGAAASHGGPTVAQGMPARKVKASQRRVSGNSPHCVQIKRTEEHLCKASCYIILLVLQIRYIGYNGLSMITGGRVEIKLTIDRRCNICCPKCDNFLFMHSKRELRA